MDNKTVYASYDFDQWVNREGLIEEEEYLVSKYLRDKNARLIEAGTGGGRIAFVLEQRGFTDITAFDFVQSFIDSARRRDPETAIDFKVADAVKLDWIEDGTCAYAIYLQQVISFIPRDSIDEAIREAYRIVRDDGLAVFSFLNWHGRRCNRILSLLVNGARFLRGSPRCKQCLPWLRLGGRFNWRLLSADQAETYWFTRGEITRRLTQTGFEIVETVTSAQIKNRAGAEGMLYVACKKRKA